VVERDTESKIIFETGVRGSVVERDTDNVKVGGSIPPGPTRHENNLCCGPRSD
jgi:hypothetical protein